ncbi:MFS transporter [Paraburkholderia hospita]|jgi:MHS family alpha-ketoglutarate permease-like MFS transporter|uniref:MFS transporter n=1 Tax=Paraburkholderia hospita TaxID=169430 RepID=UPI0009A8892B|nr:MFS transporter [Paraburkholderia hospita]AXF01462.1 MFS transporter [Paraburkholderia hospita]OUL83053.1 MFS transporter [Paraburkholderia hospita]SKC87665.1 Predicted arabinose efflux permease, MFS family [Paraburkholderia hospita]SOE85206.1 Predicted arabinose efflux permease, MFS family [Burkholderia sp. YR290]
MDTILPGVAHEEAATPLTRAQRKAIVAATLGTVVEFTDWIIYATFAALFSRHFFPANNDRVSLLSAFAVFAVGFVMRPIGGALLGAYADRHGRKNGLALSVALMAGSSLVIAVCPGYESIGIAAPLILVLARLIQGFAAGGEFGSASTFLIESSAPSRRGFAGSWQHFAVNAGVLVAALIGAILTSMIDHAGMAKWGWRVAFTIAGLLGFVALWVRLAVAETDAFRKSAATHQRTRHPFLEIVREHPRAALRVIGIAMAGNLCIYLWLVLFPTLAHLRTGLPLHDAFNASVISIVVSLIAIPFIGRLSDRIGRKPVLLVFAGGSALFAWPALHFLSNDFWSATAIVTIGMLLSSGFAATCATVMAEQFPARVRATGVALPYAVSAALFGGTLPYIVTAMSSSGLSQYLWVYVATVCAVGFVVYARMPETRGKVLD